MNEGEDRLDPRRLICGHEFCLGCLQAANGTCLRSGVKLKCMYCSTAVQNGPLTALPAVDKVSNPTMLTCDTCIRNDVQREAMFYCTDCKKKFCPNHNKSHQEINGWDHTVLSIEEYQQRSAKLETRYCPEHSSCPLTMGCKLCKNICCNICTANSQNGRPCTSRRAHEYDTLQALEQLSLNAISETTKQLVAKRNRLGELLDDAITNESKIKPYVNDLTKQLEKHKAEQIQKINNEYKKQQAVIGKAAQEHSEKLQKQAADIQQSIDRINDVIIRYKTEVPNLHSVDIVAEEQQSGNVLSSISIPEGTIPLKFQQETRAISVHQIQVRVNGEGLREKIEVAFADAHRQNPIPSTANVCTTRQNQRFGHMNSMSSSATTRAHVGTFGARGLRNPNTQRQAASGRKHAYQANFGGQPPFSDEPWP